MKADRNDLKNLQQAYCMICESHDQPTGGGDLEDLYELFVGLKKHMADSSEWGQPEHWDSSTTEEEVCDMAFSMQDEIIGGEVFTREQLTPEGIQEILAQHPEAGEKAKAIHDAINFCKHHEQANEPSFDQDDY